MNLKKIIIITIIVLVLIVSAIVSAQLSLLGEDKEEYKNEILPEEDYTADIEETIQRVDVRSYYYIVKNCVIDFYSHYSNIYNIENYNFTFDEEDNFLNGKEIVEQNIEAVYNILDKKYLEYKNITLENLSSKLPKINEVTVNITDMYFMQKDETMYAYFVYGYLIKEQSLNTTNFSLIVNIDMNNRTYTIILEDYMNQMYENIKTNEKVVIDFDESIKENDYNTFKYQTITDDAYIIDMFNSYKNDMIYNIERVYNNLDNEYKTKRFPTLDSFKQYSEKNLENNKNMAITKYQKTKNGNSTQYVCIDSNDNYCIINEKAIMEYSLILDTYTLDLPEFIEKYDSGNDQEKIQLNMGKIIEAINNQDYQYVYNKLDETFKNNNFNNINTFENYIKNNFYNKNEIKEFNYRQEGNVFICTLGSGNKENEAEGIKSVTILMKLLENRDFAISFSI